MVRAKKWHTSLQGSLGKCFTGDNIALDVVFKLNFAFPFNINTLFEASFNLKAILYNLKINKTFSEFKTYSSQKRGNVRDRLPGYNK